MPRKQKCIEEILRHLRPNLGVASLLFGLTCLSVFSQNYTPLVQNLDLLAKKNLFDQIYIQVSKGIYETGEDLWFKVYALDNQFFSPSDKNRTLYMRLAREDDPKAVWEEKYEIVNGFSEGHIYVNDTLSPGTYVLSAFTQNSIFSEKDDYHGVRKIKVVNEIAEFSLPQITPKNSLGRFSLLPEGGHLVSELKNRMAFKATDSLGFPIEVSGTLFEDGVPHLEFSSEHAGMGSFDFIPRIGKRYYVKLKEYVPDSVLRLPEIKNGGILLKSEGQRDGVLTMRVFRSPNSKGSRVFVRLQVRGVAYSMAEAICKDSLSIRIPLEDIPQGIAEITLFDENLRPMAERLVYVNQQAKLHIRSSLSNNGEYGTRDKVTLKLKVTDAKGKPVRSHLGLSIYDQAYGNAMDPKNILTHFYLTTQLKGKIQDPAYYFDEDNDNAPRAMDLLLMTQGWRRYVWSEASLKQLVSTKNAFIRDGIRGTLNIGGPDGKDAMPQPAVMAYNPVAENNMDFIIPNSTGGFNVGPEHLKMGERGYLYLRLKSHKKSRSNMVVQDNGFEVLGKRTGISYPLPGLAKDQVNDHRPFSGNQDLVELEEVQVKSKKKRVYREKYFGKLDSIVKAETTDYVCKYNILNCEYHVGDRENRKPEEGEIYFYTEVWDELSKRWVKGNKFITGSKIFRNPPLPPYRYPNYTDTELLELFGIVRVKGYYGHREFYQPNHDGKEDPFPDYRNTLLWNPSVITDASGEAELEFFCSDINTLFVGKIEGVGGDGLLGKHTFEFLVT